MAARLRYLHLCGGRQYPLVKRRSLHRPASGRGLDARGRLLSPIVDPLPAPNYPLVIAGSCLSVAGLGVAVGAHADWWSNYDTLALGLVVAGVSLKAFASRKVVRFPAGMSPESRSELFEFKLANPRTAFAAERRSLSRLCTLENLPEKVKAIIRKAQEADEERMRSAARVREEAMIGEASRIAEAVDAPTKADATAMDDPVTLVERIVSKLCPRLFVLDYTDSPLRDARPGGPSRAQLFGEEVSFILSCASPHDEVLIRLTSPGGRVSEFGLATSHMLRLRNAGLATTVAVDTVRRARQCPPLPRIRHRLTHGRPLILWTDSSLGRLYDGSRCRSNRSRAFRLPRQHRRRRGSAQRAAGSQARTRGLVDVHGGQVQEVHSLGPEPPPPTSSPSPPPHQMGLGLSPGPCGRRTITPFSEVTPEARDKFQEDLNAIHEAFKDHVKATRGAQITDVDSVATGEAWLAVYGKHHGLVDDLCTSNDVIEAKAGEGYDVVLVARKARPRSLQSLFNRAQDALGHVEELATKLRHLFTPATSGSAHNAELK